MKYMILFSIIALLFYGCDMAEKYGTGKKNKGISIKSATKEIPSLSEVQRCLKKKGFDPGRIDGVLGWQTKKAIRDFQNANNLKITGTVNQETWAKLRITDIKEITPEEVRDRLKKTSWVRKIQNALRNLGFDPGPIDGRIGPKTKKAVRDFQKANGLVADGVINTKTWKVLSAYFPEDDL